MSGKQVPNEQIVKIARLFRDEVTLDNIPRPQLVSLCKYMGLTPYGPDVFLRSQLRRQLRAIEADDELIMKEGIDTLSLDEIKQACMERGMRASGVPAYLYKKHLVQWIDLSLKQDIPASLLILSRSFTLLERGESDAPLEALQTTIVSLAEVCHMSHCAGS